MKKKQLLKSTSSPEAVIQPSNLHTTNNSPGLRWAIVVIATTRSGETVQDISGSEQNHSTTLVYLNKAQQVDYQNHMVIWTFSYHFSLEVKADLASQAQPPPSLGQPGLGRAKRPLEEDCVGSAQIKIIGFSNLNMAGGIVLGGPDMNTEQVMVPDKAEIVSNIQMAHESDGLPEPIDQANAKIESIFTAEMVGGAGVWVSGGML